MITVFAQRQTARLRNRAQESAVTVQAGLAET